MESIQGYDTLLDDAVKKRHSHSNKTVLDGITADKVSKWDAGGDLKKLTIKLGSSTYEYDGSAAVTVEMPVANGVSF